MTGQCGKAVSPTNVFPEHVEGLRSKVKALLVVTCDVALYDGHAVGGQCAGLVRTYRRGVAHRLACVQMPYQVVVEHHFLHPTKTRKVID